MAYLIPVQNIEDLIESTGIQTVSRLLEKVLKVEFKTSIERNPMVRGIKPRGVRIERVVRGYVVITI